MSGPADMPPARTPGPIKPHAFFTGNTIDLSPSPITRFSDKGVKKTSQFLPTRPGPQPFKYLLSVDRRFCLALERRLFTAMVEQSRTSAISS